MPSDYELFDGILTSSADHIKRDHDHLEFFVGVAGDTGMGKTSLLNALVNPTSDVAPSSQNGACTASVCCFRFSDSNDKLTATIKFKSMHTVQEELDSLFQEEREFENRVQTLSEGYDSVVEAERQRIREQIDIICGWSGLKYNKVKAFAAAHTTSEIISLCSDRQILFNEASPKESQIKKISVKDTGEFLRQIKGFVGSSGPGKQVMRWPLVEQVDIYLNSSLLQCCKGLVLVDLPGESDAIESRSRVARDYYAKLDRMMAVTPSDRARDNRTAAELIRDDQICDLEAEGKLDDGSLAVVISKVDQLNWSNYVTNEVDPEKISPDFPVLKDRFDAKTRRIEELKQEIEALKRKAGDGTESPEDEASLRNELREVEDCRNDLHAKCLRACIKHRSVESQKTLQEYFDKVRNAMRQDPNSKAITQLPVFSISSMAQQCLKRGIPSPAFSDEHVTGFKALEKWIIDGSLPKREEHADNILHRCQVLLDAMSGWVKDNKAPVTMSQKSLEATEKNIQKQVDVLDVQLEKSTDKFSIKVGTLAPFSTTQKKDAKDKLVAGFPCVVDHFGIGPQGAAVHWATYAACIRRLGGTFRTGGSPPVVHDWQAKL